MKKFLFLALIGIIAMSCNQQQPEPPIEIIAQGYCGAQGNNLVWVLSNDSVLTISGSGEMRNFETFPTTGDVVISDVPWLSYREAIKTVVIGNGVTSIGDWAFADCRNLVSATIGSSVTSIGDGSFFRCNNLTFVNIPNSVTFIGNQAFINCRSLTSIIIPDNITTIEYWTFAGCSGLISVEIPNSVTTIKEGAFAGCSGLTSVTIPNSVRTIGRRAFENCNSLTSVTIGSSVISIGNYAFFYNGNSLISIICYALIPPNLESNFVFYQVNTSSVYLHVPAESIELYRNAQGWRDFQNIVAIQD